MTQQNSSWVISILAIFLLIQYPLTVNSIFEINVRHTENDPALQVYRIEPYADGSVLIRVVKDIGGECTESMLRIRIVHPKGTITPIDVHSHIPDFNYCFMDFGEKGGKKYGIHVYSLIPEFFLVAYLNTTDVAASPAVYGLIVNWQGEILS